MDRDEILRRTREAVSVALGERDRLLIHTVGAVSELDKTINLLSTRLREWYGLYFPELKAEGEKFPQLVLAINRDSIDEEELAKVVGSKKAHEIANSASKSLGAKFEPDDIEQMKELAKLILSLYEIRKKLSEYEEKLASDVAPNTSYIVGPAITAELIAKAGSIEKLARMSASRIQVMGAEKALFKHLRKHTKPPKHGIIFKHPYISMSPKKVRGKIARLLSAKISIAAKGDAYTKHFIAEKLKEDLEKKLILLGIKGEHV
ncbi:MAG: hypothetical protein QXP42_06050 [Candidatus Micrarchaeia archaeon]